MKPKELTERIRSSAQLAAVLEVSAWPKPGNVHRTKDHSDARYEQFLAGSIALGSSVEAAVNRGVRVAQGRVDVSHIGVGALVKKGVSDVASSHYGGNTHLGICLLFVPLASAAAKTFAESKEITVDRLRDNVKLIMKSTTAGDAVAVYEAISSVSSFGGLGKVEGVRSPDLLDKDAKKKILENEVTLFDVMKESSSYDTIAKELVTGMEICFKIGYETLIATFEETKDVNIAAVNTFLRILSQVPDTFIARKIGLKRTTRVNEAVEIGIKETTWISKTAEEILTQGGLTTYEGRTSLWELDRKLQNLGKDYSPGTTADLTAAAILIGLLLGLKF